MFDRDHNSVFFLGVKRRALREREIFNSVSSGVLLSDGGLSGRDPAERIFWPDVSGGISGFCYLECLLVFDLRPWETDGDLWNDVCRVAAASAVFSVVSKKEGSNKEDVSCLFASVDDLSFVIRSSTKRKRNRPIGHRCLPERDG